MTLNWIDSFRISRIALPSPVRVFDMVLGWIERTQQRRALARLDDRLLADIGLNRCDVDRETAKPAWRE